jgi:nitrite reductase/ring-hydroxylating ferredoxin subunit
MTNERLVLPGEAICESSALEEAGRGVRFQVQHAGHATPAFIVRHQGCVRGFLNRCAHRLVELDWERGEFFDSEKLYLICSTHGALYDPTTGACLGGPCRGQRLIAVPVVEQEGVIRLAG